MTPDYRALCAELVDALDNLLALVNGECPSLLDGDRGGSGFLDIEIDDALTTARALLAQPVAEGPTDAELWTMYDEMRGEPGDWAWVRDFARAALARWGRPAAAPVPDLGEVAELVSWLRDRAESTSLAHAALRITRAADLLQRQYPQPVLVSERLPGPGEWVWHCYAGVRFWQHGRYNGRQFFIGNGPESQPATHWLPANALPAPEATND